MENSPMRSKRGPGLCKPPGLCRVWWGLRCDFSASFPALGHPSFSSVKFSRGKINALFLKSVFNIKSNTLPRFTSVD